MLRDYEAVLKAAADPSRARVLKMLEAGELCVCQMVAVLGLSPSTVSRHLSLLRAAGLVEERKAGKWVHFRLAEARLNDYALSLLRLLGGWLREDGLIREDARKAGRIRRIPVEQLCHLGAEGIARKLAASRGGAGG